MNRIVIPVVDVKGQYNHLITRVLNEIGAESKLVPISITKNDLNKMNARGLVMGGGPQRIGSEIKKLGVLPELIKELDIPILGLCLTHQLIAIVFGGRAGEAKFPEYGPVEIFVDKKDEILKGFPKKFIAWESHNDEVLTLPDNFEILAHSKKCNVQVMRHLEKPVFGIQFHPEVIHTENGELIFKNFFNICKNY